jgi:hypothetical protein
MNPSDIIIKIKEFKVGKRKWIGEWPVEANEGSRIKVAERERIMNSRDGGVSQRAGERGQRDPGGSFTFLYILEGEEGRREEDEVAPHPSCLVFSRESFSKVGDR